MTCTPTFVPSSARASPTRRFKSSDSTTHGPAMRNGDAPPAKCCAMSVAAAGELRRPLRLGEGRGAPRPGVLARRAHESGEQGVWPGGAGLELGVELAADEPGVIRKLDHLDQRAVRREPGAAHTVFGEHVAVRIRHFVAVPVPLAHLERAVDLRDPGAGTQFTGIRAQSHRAAHFLMPSWERISAITGFSHSGANSLELVSGSLTTSRANSMMAACNPRQIPRKGSLCSRAQRIASSMPSTPRTPKPPGTSNPSYVPSSSPAAAWSVKRSDEIQSIWTPHSFAMPPCPSASWMLL